MFRIFTFFTIVASCLLLPILSQTTKHSRFTALPNDPPMPKNPVGLQVVYALTYIDQITFEFFSTITFYQNPKYQTDNPSSKEKWSMNLGFSDPSIIINRREEGIVMTPNEKGYLITLGSQTDLSKNPLSCEIQGTFKNETSAKDLIPSSWNLYLGDQVKAKEMSMDSNSDYFISKALPTIGPIKLSTKLSRTNATSTNSSDDELLVQPNDTQAHVTPDQSSLSNSYELDANGTYLVGFPIGLAIYGGVFFIGFLSYLIGSIRRLQFIRKGSVQPSKTKGYNQV